jgi:predicted RNA-binding Zn-ribbon protein involved in translation (DUF1610 family)
MSNEMHCPRCGLEGPEDRERCKACGTILTAEAATRFFADDPGATGAFAGAMTGAFPPPPADSVPPAIDGTATEDGSDPEARPEIRSQVIVASCARQTGLFEPAGYGGGVRGSRRPCHVFVKLLSRKRDGRFASAPYGAMIASLGK